ncbi:hypothetical protein RND71_002576 [Anisodus tanguticus]|uniref:Uncharacterized protein n=1 Tax=Anisodus tanguticus TaxID=243964 RepID=A0AAE1T1E4_9SOLA|nr:hypothetical protein RND71_002576 [Anisodus tanguticus]
MVSWSVMLNGLHLEMKYRRKTLAIVILSSRQEVKLAFTYFIDGSSQLSVYLNFVLKNCLVVGLFLLSLIVPLCKL